MAGALNQLVAKVNPIHASSAAVQVPAMTTLARLVTSILLLAAGVPSHGENPLAGSNYTYYNTTYGSFVQPSAGQRWPLLLRPPQCLPPTPRRRRAQPITWHSNWHRTSPRAPHCVAHVRPSSALKASVTRRSKMPAATLWYASQHSPMQAAVAGASSASCFVG